MPANRLTLVACFCSLGSFVMRAPAVTAQDVAERLNEAHERYEQSIEQIEQDAITRLDELIDRYSDEGNLQKVLELRAQKAKLLEDRAWPESIIFRTMREKIRSSRVRAKRELANAYEEAIAALTKERRYDDAVALRAELDELTKIQAAFDFRSEEPNRKKPAKEDDLEPAEKPQAKNVAKAKVDTPPKPLAAAASKPSNIDLAAALVAATAKTPLDSVTATSEEKKEILNKIVKDLYTQWPPRRWTAQQFDDFVAFFAAASAKVDTKSCMLPQVAPDASTGVWAITSEGRGVSGSVDSVQKFAVGYPGKQWIVSSPTPDEFVSRATHLQAKEYWPAVNKELEVDDLKLWLKSVGCMDAKGFKAVLEELGQADVRLAALDKLRAELGE
jgi:hypothetical protein